MNQRFKDFQSAFPEEACLDALMQARHGSTTLSCAACGKISAFAPRVKLRAYTCGACNYLVYPGAGTPLENRRTSLQLWFFAIRLVAAGTGKAAAVLAKEAALSPVLARRMVEDLEALGQAGGKAGPDWLVAIARRVAPAPAVSAATTDLPQSAAAPRQVRPRPAAAAAAVPWSRAAMVIGLCALGIVGAVAAAGMVIASRRSEPAPAQFAESDVPALRAAARPSLILSSVESDLEAARQATQFALRSDPSLAAIQQQDASAPEPPRPPGVQPPTNIILVPPRLPAGAPATPPRQPPRPAAGSGDPEQILTFGPIRIRRHLVDIIVRAGRIVGADPTLLMAVADKESSFSTAVQAKTSSATGLYQFIEQTWLGVISEFGSRHGMAAEARLIVRSGRQFTVADAAERQRILDLRREPYLSALLAAEMLKRDTLRLERAMGRHLSGGEIYLIHFLGPDAAQTFINTMEETPGAKAAELLPRPAQANRPIFYAEAGGETKTLSVSEVHKKFNDMIKLRLDRYGDVRKLWVQGAKK
jgi:hypothetical protein